MKIHRDPINDLGEFVSVSSDMVSMICGIDTDLGLSIGPLVDHKDLKLMDFVVKAGNTVCP